MTTPVSLLLFALIASAPRHLLEQLPAAGYQASVIEPLGIGTSARPEKGDYSLTRQADRIATVLQEFRTGTATPRRPSACQAALETVKQQRGLGSRSQQSVTGAPMTSASSPCTARQASGRRATVADRGQPLPRIRIPSGAGSIIRPCRSCARSRATWRAIITGSPHL